MADEALVVAAERRVRRREWVLRRAGPLLPGPADGWTAGAPILLYHRVVPPGARPTDPFSIALDHFESHLDWLAEQYSIVSVGALVKRLASGNAKGLAAVSLDDGYDCTRSRVLPALLARGLPATVFIDTARLGGPAPALREADIRELAAAGIEIGSHSISHRDLTRLHPSDLATELVESRARLQDVTGQSVDGFAAPFGWTNARVNLGVQEAGYAYACSCRQDHTNQRGTNVFALTRIEITAGDDLPAFQAKLAGRYARVYAAWYGLRRAFARDTERV